MDSAPIISTDKTPPIVGVEEQEDVSISSEELKELRQVVSHLKDGDRSSLEELKEDREEYIEVGVAQLGVT